MCRQQERLYSSSARLLYPFNRARTRRWSRLRPLSLSTCVYYSIACRSKKRSLVNLTRKRWTCQTKSSLWLAIKDGNWKFDQAYVRKEFWWAAASALKSKIQWWLHSPRQSSYWAQHQCFIQNVSQYIVHKHGRLFGDLSIISRKDYFKDDKWAKNPWSPWLIESNCRVRGKWSTTTYIQLLNLAGLFERWDVGSWHFEEIPWIGKVW